MTDNNGDKPLLIGPPDRLEPHPLALIFPAYNEDEYYDRPGIYNNCKSNEDRDGLLQCCDGVASWKAACDVSHIHAESHADARELANSTKAGRKAFAADFRDCTK